MKMTINELIQDLIFDRIKLSQALMYVKVTYGKSLKKDSYEWVCSELDHYEDAKSIPDYRIINCDVKVQVFIPFFGSREETLDTSIINNSLSDSVKAYASPNKMLIRQSITSIEQSIGSLGKFIEMELLPNQIEMLMRFYSLPTGARLEKMYQESRSEYILNILSSVRDKLVSILQEELLTSSNSTGHIKPEPVAGKKRVFISYGWDSIEHKDWVIRLAERLSKYFDVVIDAKVPLGTDLNHFMEQMVTSSDRVLLILTPLYKEKADKRLKGVGYESVLISSELYANQLTTKIIPVIRKGTIEECYPLYLGSRKGLDMTDDKFYEQRISELIKDIESS